MRSFIYRIVLILLVAAGIQSCKTTGGLTDKARPGKSWRVALAECKGNPVEFTTLNMSGKARAEMSSMDFNMNISYRVQIHADSLIMIRFSKIGIEAIRVYMDRDSIYILDKFQRTYQVASYDKAYELTGLEADFDLIQDLLIGNLNQIPEKLDLEDKRADPFVFKGMKELTDFSYSIRRDDFKLSRLEARNPILDQHSLLQYNQFKEVDGQLFCTEGIFKVISPKNILFDFRHNKVDINPSRISIKIAIPNGYERLP